jgi:hypothetical protein
LPGTSKSAGTVILYFPNSRTIRNKFLLFTSHPIYDTFVIPAQVD